jgi:hypothetical protein
MPAQQTPGATTSPAGNAAARQVQQQSVHAWPQLGANDEGLPMYSGAPNCYHYMGTGRCPAQGSVCRYHHPNRVLLPAVSVETGVYEPEGPVRSQYPAGCLHVGWNRWLRR